MKKQEKRVLKSEKDPNDCHRLPYLDQFIGIRAIITTTRGVCRGRLVYAGGWYYCQAGERLVDGEWVQVPYRFLFRKGDFKKIVKVPNEDSCGR